MSENNMKHVVVGIHIPDRFEQANRVQSVLTKYGCSIKTRLGLHETSKEHCAVNGLLILEMYINEDEMKQMMKEIKEIEGGIEVQKMIFESRNAQ